MVGLSFGGRDNLVMESRIRQLSRLAMFALVCRFVALAVRANLFALIFGAETAVAMLWAIWLAK
jgi:hypothetical protein